MRMLKTVLCCTTWLQQYLYSISLFHVAQCSACGAYIYLYIYIYIHIYIYHPALSWEIWQQKLYVSPNRFHSFHKNVENYWKLPNSFHSFHKMERGLPLFNLLKSCGNCENYWAVFNSFQHSCENCENYWGKRVYLLSVCWLKNKLAELRKNKKLSPTQSFSTSDCLTAPPDCIGVPHSPIYNVQTIWGDQTRSNKKPRYR